MTVVFYTIILYIFIYFCTNGIIEIDNDERGGYRWFYND